MADLVRISVSLEANLLAEFDGFCAKRHFAPRSEAIRQLLRETLTEQAWEADARDTAAALTLVYDHPRTQLSEKSFTFSTITPTWLLPAAMSIWITITAWK